MKIIVCAMLMIGCSFSEPTEKQADYRCHEKACRKAPPASMFGSGDSNTDCECPPLAKVEVAVDGTILCKCP